MRILKAGRPVLAASFLGLMLAAGLAPGAGTTAAQAAETIIKFSLDFKFEGPSATFLLPLDKGYYKAEGLNVSIDSAAGSVEPINRVASGTYDMGFADINSLIRFRDTNPTIPLKAVFMVYNKPPFAIVGRKSRGVSKPKDLEGKKLGAPAADGAYAQWPIFVKANDIDASKVTIENVGFPVREPMLAAGQVDAITGFSFSSFINLKDKGVPVDDITVLLMADYGVNLYGNTIIVNPKFAAAHPDAVKGFLKAYLKGLKETVKSPATAVELGAQAQRHRQEGDRVGTSENGDPRQHRYARGQGQWLWWRRRSSPGQSHRSDRPDLQVEERQAEAGRYLRRLVSAAGGRPQVLAAKGKCRLSSHSTTSLTHMPAPDRRWRSRDCRSGSSKASSPPSSARRDAANPR